MAKSAPYIDPRNTWVTSDSHWGHTNIIEYCRRPQDFEDLLVEEWNAAVPDDATVLHLGDLTYKNNSMFKHVVAPRLKGERKLLIKGNHDRCRPSLYRAAGFKMVSPFEMRYDTSEYHKGLAQRWIVSFAHYPLRAPNDSVRDGIVRKRVHIHGHIHNNGYCGRKAPYIPFAAGQINVSVEQTHYRPVNLDELLRGHILGAYEPPTTKEITDEQAQQR